MSTIPSGQDWMVVMARPGDGVRHGWWAPRDDATSTSSPAGMDTLESLELDLGERPDLPDWLQACGALRSLRVRGCVEEIPEWLAQLPLQSLALDGLALERRPLPMPPSLQSLRLRGCGLSPKVELAHDLPELASLDLSGNDLLELPVALLRRCGASLSALSLSRNRLMDLDGLGKLCPKLVTLRAACNRLRLDAFGLRKCTGLRHADLSRNRIEFVELEQGLPDGLDTLHLDGNPLDELPAGLGGRAALRVLRLTGARVATVHAEAIRDLESLHLGWNQVEELSGPLDSCARLRHLDLAGNPLRELPESLARVDTLETLDLSGTRVQRLPKGPLTWSRLRQLQLDGTAVRELPAGLGDCGALETLSLRGCRHLRLPSALAGCARMRLIRLTGAGVDEGLDTLARLPRLGRIVVGAQDRILAQALVGHLGRRLQEEIA